MLEAIEQTARNTRERIVAIRDLLNETVDLVKRELPKVYSKDLLELLFRQPYCKIRFLEAAGIARRQTASAYLWELERLGLLRALKMGREYYFINIKLLEILIK
jgi:Fic family protein